MQTASEKNLCGEEAVFENVQKQISLEVVNFVPLKTYSNDLHLRIRKKEEKVGWKWAEFQHPVLESRSTNYRFSHNISFEDEPHQAYTDANDTSNDEPQQSSFSTYYQDCDQLYHKKYAFGSNWIGRKQYFASNFIHPSLIEKGNLEYYYKQEANQESSNRVCAFDSNFQSGNLLSVFRINQNQYDLILQNDFNTKGNTQWFYFRITNPPKNVAIKLNIVNMRKSDSLFNYGMMPCILSSREEARTKKGWLRGGRSIKYYKNDHQIENSRRFYYTLAFTVQTPYDHDILRIAQSYPYTYTNLNTYLDNTLKSKYKKELIERQSIINTIGGNKIQILTIRQLNSKIKIRPFIFIIARQHPGQTPASFVCQGLIDSLLSKQKQGQFIRKHYQVKIIPMMNPDGVCAGNYRSNLYGYDLNRRWQGSKIKNLHEATYVKKYINNLTKGREVAFILDLHGHSRKMFSFFYGNPNQGNPVAARIFPLICSKVNPHQIKFEDCAFTSEQSKRNTARVQFGLSYKCSNILTFESSFFGYFGKEKEKKHYSMNDYRQLGATLVRAIYIHERGKEMLETNSDQKDIIIYKRCLNELRNSNDLISLGEKQNSGSQSCPEECELKQNENICLNDNQQNRVKSEIKSSIKISNLRKSEKKQLVKLPSRSQRQMQVMNMAQVNSIFPSNLLALIPASYLAKKRVAKYSKSVQTDNTPLIKIYQTCKMQQSHIFGGSQTSIPHPRGEFGSNKKNSNLLRSNIFTRPKSESQNREMLSSVGLSKVKEKQLEQAHQKTHFKNKKVSSPSLKGLVSKEVQTTLTFNCMNLGQIKSKMDKQISILEYKTVDPSYSSFNYNRFRQTRSIGKANINYLQALKVKNNYKF